MSSIRHAARDRRFPSTPASALMPRRALGARWLLGVMLLAGLSAWLLQSAPAWAGAPLETDLGERLQRALGGGSGGESSFLFSYLLAFAAGLATSLTPCVYPLIPITVSLFGARDDQVSRAGALGLAACYVGGMAAMYSGLGVVVALTGGFFGTFLSNPYFIVPLAVFFLVMASSMFGAFELALPTELQGRLSRVGGKGAGGAFLMGLVAGLIAAPCTGPPLAALLAFVSTKRSVALGGSLLFVYALGMGVLFFVIAGFALKLPRSGPWMEKVKSIFGVVMIVAALYFLRNVLTPLREYGRPGFGFLAINAVAVVAGVAVGGISLTYHEGMVAAVRKSLGVVLLAGGLYGGVAWLLTPKLVEGAADAPVLSWLSKEEPALAQAKQQHKPLIIDFGANWCLPCQEMELKTFSNPQVRKELTRFVLLRIDASEVDDYTDKLMKKYDSTTLPSVLLFDSSGQQVMKLKEFTPPDKFLEVARKIQ